MGPEVAQRETFEKLLQLGRDITVGVRGGIEAQFAQGAGDLAVADTVEPPELFGPPGGHGGWVDAGDIGVGHERQQAQALVRLGERGDVARRLGIIEVPRLKDGREGEVILDEEQDDGRIHLVQSGPFKETAAQADGFLAVVLAAALADVVQEEGQFQQPEVVLRLFGQRGEFQPAGGEIPERL